MDKPVIALDKAEIQAKMWDTCNGNHVLAVRPDGTGSCIFWAETNRQWDPWPEDWLVIPIPAIDPDGSGEGTEDAEDLLKALGLYDQAQDLIEAEDIGTIDAIEQLAPDDWKVNREEAAEWLADAFIDACNGNGLELNQPAPWGYRYDEQGMPDDIDPPARFEWA